MKRIRTSIGVCKLVLGFMLATTVAPLMAQDWPMFGQNAANTASTAQTDISTKTVYKLMPKWTFTTGGDVSARAAVVNGVAYFPDWGGYLWAVNTSNGKAIWEHQLSDYIVGATPGSIHARSTPAISGGVLYIGTQEGATLLAINAATGSLVWKRQLESVDQYAIITTSPTVYGGVVYEGVASTAEGASLYGINLSTYTARGSVVAVSARTGSVIWKTYTVPQGYTGGGVWGSNPVVDPSRNTLFIGTGDNYTHPDSSAPSSNPSLTYGQCIASNTEANCLAPDDYVDAILALNMSDGTVKWAKSKVTWSQYDVMDGSDDWNVDCLLPALGYPVGPQCPSNPGPDYDFGSAPNEVTYKDSQGVAHTIIGAGQKSGLYYALDPDTGALLWQTQVGPGSALGGMEWGSASDGKRIYVAIANLYAIPYGPGGSINAGSWSALDPATGAILWQTADPNGSVDIGPMAVANGVVYASSMAGAATAPTMFAFDAATGTKLWSFAAGASVNAGATIVQDTVYWGSGYTHLHFPGQTGGTNKFFAFTPNGT